MIQVKAEPRNGLPNDAANLRSTTCDQGESHVDQDYATIHVVEPGKRATGAAILEAALRLEADLLVMGAYGHTRLREWILGGATRDLLSKGTLPILMMH